MTERPHAVECPVCPGLPMSRIRIGRDKVVEVDTCRRCGGLWLERGGVQRLRAHGANHFKLYTTRAGPPQPAQCHGCRAVLDRDCDKCPACQHGNHLNCPVCDAVMPVVVHDGVRLDVCRSCKGAWFDHHELDTLWGARFDTALQRRKQVEESSTFLGGDAVAFDVLFFSPDVVGLAATGIGDAAGEVGAAVGQLPELLAASPEAAAGLLEIVGDSAAEVLEVVVEVVAGVFG